MLSSHKDKLILLSFFKTPPSQSTAALPRLASTAFLHLITWTVLFSFSHSSLPSHTHTSRLGDYDADDEHYRRHHALISSNRLLPIKLADRPTHSLQLFVSFSLSLSLCSCATHFHFRTLLAIHQNSRRFFAQLSPVGFFNSFIWNVDLSSLTATPSIGQTKGDGWAAHQTSAQMWLLSKSWYQKCFARSVLHLKIKKNSLSNQTFRASQ